MPITTLAKISNSFLKKLKELLKIKKEYIKKNKHIKIGFDKLSFVLTNFLLVKIKKT